MTMTSNRPYATPTYPASPAPTTASSLNYSQYGTGSFSTPSRHQTSISVSSSSQAPIGALRDMRNPQQAHTDLAPKITGQVKERRAESKEVAKVHWKALREFLQEWLQKESPTARASAREKLTRLTKLQFQELSTDVYDELMRRIDTENGTPDNLPFLPVREDFHPKRNQARQKLATLPKNRFKDLASDVFHELCRRYPEFQDEQQSTTYADEPPPAPGPVHQRPPQVVAQPQPHSLRERERLRDNPTPPPISRLDSAGHQRQGSRNISAGSSVGSAMLDRPRPSLDSSRSFSDRLNGGGGAFGAQPTAATNDVVVPVKSRMKEEEIQVPYARESLVDRPLSTASRDSRASSVRDFREKGGARTPRGDGDPQDMISPRTADDREYYDRMSFSSNLTSKSRALGQGPIGWDDDREQKIRSEYELRIAGLERKIGSLEGEKEELARKENDQRERGREWEDEVRGLKERAALHASNLRSLQHELDLARDAAEAARSHTDQSGRQAQEEINQWRDRCDNLEDEVRRLEVEKTALEAAVGAGGAGSYEAVSELKAEIHSLVDELNALSARNDDLIAARERDAQAMNDMEAQVAEYKRKYDSVRIELRNLKATSTMFVSKPVNDDHLPASPDGNIADVHVSAFQGSIDGMLQAARSSTPSGVLPAMKAIVEAITEIGEDVKTFEAHPNIDVDVSRLESLKHESTTRLNYLMQAARNHAMASGLSPVSLIDAAAGHLSANVVEIIKLLKIRRTVKEQGNGPAVRPNRSSMSIKDMVDRTRGAGTPTEPKSASSIRSNPFGSEERLREPAAPVRQSSADDVQLHPDPQPMQMNRQQNGSNSGSGGIINGMLSNLRINSYQSVASSIARSDSFDLERKASIASDRQAPRPNIHVHDERERRPNGAGDGPRHGRMSEASETSGSSSVLPVTADLPAEEYKYNEDREPEVFNNEGGNEQEWDDVKPYLETQSSALVNAIQNLLAAIRTGTQTPALNEHLSEVIAIASSIVAISTNALPAGLRGEGGPLLKDLVANTNKLSEAQEQAKGGGFDKSVRQVIASASFGVAKSLKAIMKLGSE